VSLREVPSQIESIEQGKLLSSIMLTTEKFRLESIITTTSLERLSLERGESVIALINSSDLSIAEIL